MPRAPHHRNSPFPLQHVHYEPVYPPSPGQVPHHASKVPGGVEQLILAMLVQVLICESMYLKMTRHKNNFNSGRCRCTNAVYPRYM